MRLKIGDCAIIIAVLALAVIASATLTTANTGNKTVVVMQGKRIIKQLNLDSLKEPLTITIDDEYHNIIVLENGKARFAESDCPDKVCVHTGWLSRPGQIAVCLPNKTTLKIQGSNPQDNEIDVITR